MLRWWSRYVGIVLLGSMLGRSGHAAIPGDVNCDGVVDDADVETVEALVFNDPPGATSPCGAGDVNSDQVISAADIIELSRRLEIPPPVGPQIAFIGVAGPDGSVNSPTWVGPDGVALYQRSAGSGFLLVIEARPGSDNTQAGTVTFADTSGDPDALPDLQIEASRSIGSGIPGACGDGGIPGFDMPDFSASPAVATALDAFGCGFMVNTGQLRSCTTDAFGSPKFVSGAPLTVQFCLLVSASKAFPRAICGLA